MNSVKFIDLQWLAGYLEGDGYCSMRRIMIILAIVCILSTPTNTVKANHETLHPALQLQMDAAFEGCMVSAATLVGEFGLPVSQEQAEANCAMFVEMRADDFIAAALRFYTEEELFEYEGQIQQRREQLPLEQAMPFELPMPQMGGMKIY